MRILPVWTRTRQQLEGGVESRAGGESMMNGCKEVKVGIQGNQMQSEHKIVQPKERHCVLPYFPNHPTQLGTSTDQALQATQTTYHGIV